jgi:hypothetical protein
VRQLEECCREAGRAPDTVRRLVATGFVARPLESLEAFREVAGRYREMGFTDLVVHWPRADELFRGRREVLEQIAQEHAARS